MNKLLATTLESKIHVFDMRTQNDAHGGFASVTEKAHDSTVWIGKIFKDFDIINVIFKTLNLKIGKHLPQNREVFMTCGGSGSMYLWK